MEALTKDQSEKLLTWNEQRDALLSAISVLRSEEEKLTNVNKALAFSNLDIETRMNEIRGRIEELKTKEVEFLSVTSKEVAFLESRKTILESEITNLSKMIEALKPQKAGLEADMISALANLNAIRGEALLLDKVVDKVTAVSEENSRKITAIVSELATSLESMVSVNKKNVDETNIVIEKLPAMLMELQKRGLIKSRQAIIKSID